MMLQDVLGYEGYYAAAEDGSIYRVKTREGKPICRMVAMRIKNGYAVAHLCMNAVRKDVLAHRAVWQAFNGPIPDGLQINHKNGVRHDNRLSNLEVVTIRENAIHKYKVNGYRSRGRSPEGVRNHAAKLSDDDIRAIRKLAADGVIQKEIGRRFGISQVMAGKIANRKNWSHVQD